MANRYAQRFKTAEQRFREQFREDLSSGCWLWTGVVATGHRLPYGRFWLNARSIVAHRASWTLLRGPIPSGLLVLHACDQPRCVNPGHLFLGTAKDNTQDMIAKGRDAPCRLANRGERSPKAKLTEEHVRDALRSPLSQSRMAANLGVSQTLISKIRRRKVWRDLAV